MSRELGVSIINYRTGPMTISAVRSVLSALNDLDASVVVVDNASNDGSADEIADWIQENNDPRVELLRSDCNSGFSGGHNQAIASMSEAKNYLLVNSDALLLPGFFEALLPAIGSNRTSGIFAPQLEWEDGTPQESCFRFMGPVSELIRGACTGPVTRIFRSRDVSLGCRPLPNEIDWASFACICLRGEMVREIGVLDEGYFLYFEDAEYCLRARRSGWGLVYVPEARAVHLRGGSGPVKGLQAQMKRLPPYYWMSRARFLRQAHGPIGPLLGNLAWALGRLVAHSRRFIGRSVPPSHEGEWRDIWTNTTTKLELARGSN